MEFLFKIENVEARSHIVLYISIPAFQVNKLFTGQEINLINALFKFSFLLLNNVPPS